MMFEPPPPTNGATTSRDANAAGDGPVGVMLHHAVTDAGNLAGIDELLALIAGHESAVSTSIYNSSL